MRRTNRCLAAIATCCLMLGLVLPTSAVGTANLSEYAGQSHGIEVYVLAPNGDTIRKTSMVDIPAMATKEEADLLIREASRELAGGSFTRSSSKNWEEFIPESGILTFSPRTNNMAGTLIGTGHIEDGTSYSEIEIYFNGMSNRPKYLSVRATNDRGDANVWKVKLGSEMSKGSTSIYMSDGVYYGNGTLSLVEGSNLTVKASTGSSSDPETDITFTAKAGVNIR